MYVYITYTYIFYRYTEIINMAEIDKLNVI